MNVKEFLLTEKKINLSAIAWEMWPDNKGAHSYLSRKLNNIDGRTFTDKDSALALKVLKNLGIKIDELTP
ncbi:hypothetical protein [Arcticibacter eurypsychrophilus]|uniref:hypothetical protein n=1 Tax=Arcticibacter eurypsychrophilus TaxID=1434752 RepID=UPI00084DF5CC|nr:hypothetical protein [Arcticibacter eurypsychrophilus]